MVGSSLAGQFVIVMGRTSILEPGDLAPLHAMQDGRKLTLLNSYLGTQSPPVGPSRALATRDPDQVTLVEYEGGHARLWNLDRERFDNALTEFLTG